MWKGKQYAPWRAVLGHLSAGVWDDLSAVLWDDLSVVVWDDLSVVVWDDLSVDSEIGYNRRRRSTK